MKPQTPGLFVTGTDTDVGKTYVTALIARALCEQGRRVGVYKPAASGCREQAGELISDDAVMLWTAAGQPGDLERVCPQRFRAPLAPHLAARDEGRTIDDALLREGLRYWMERSDVVLVEGAGGLMSPISDQAYVSDLAHDFGFPLIVVARNALGTINHTLQTLMVAATYRGGLPVAGLVLNDVGAASGDLSVQSNRQQLEARCTCPLLAHVAWQAASIQQPVDWFSLARFAVTRPVNRVSSIRQSAITDRQSQPPSRLP